MNGDEKQGPAADADPFFNPPASLGPAGTGGQEAPPGEGAFNPAQSWSQFVEIASDKEIEARYGAELGSTRADYAECLSDYRVLVHLAPHSSLNEYDLSVVQAALSTPDGETKDVLLILLSPGGEIEPAYQISKLCKARARRRFVVAIPRKAKSAATLLALGADELHIGPLGQLGPIDVQLDGRPALAVKEALRTIASISNEFPRSARMFAEYLRRTLKVEHIGYCDRISESAVQYAMRLLTGKPTMGARAEQIARDLVYAYKHHSFVIDLDEARSRLGDEWVRTDTPELAFAESVLRSFEFANLCLTTRESKPKASMVVRGRIDAPSVWVLNHGA